MENLALVPDVLGLFALGSFSFVITLSETSLIALPRERVQAWQAKAQGFAKPLASLLEDRKKLFFFFEFLEWSCGALYFLCLALIALAPHFVPAAIAVFAGGVVAYIFLCQFFPRRLASLHIDRISRLLGPSVAVTFKLFGWTAAVLDGFSKVLSDLFAREPNATNLPLSGEEIKMLVALGKDEPLEIEKEEKEMIESVMTFGRTMVKEIMTPRIDMVCVESTTAVKEVLDLAISRGYSKFPVYDDNIDNILGIVYLKDLFRALRDGETAAPLKPLMRKPFFVPESKMVDDLLREMQRQKISMAIIVDEYGGTDGLVTLEDIVEEIVGEIEDEHDAAVPDILPLGENTWLVDGQINLEDLNREAELHLPTEEFETLSGYVYGRMGKVPKIGDKIQTPQVILEIMVINRQRISKVKLTKKAPVEEEKPKEELS